MSTPNDLPTPEWVTLKQAAEATGKTVKTVRRWATIGKVGAQKDPTGKWFVRKSDLLREAPVAEAKAELEVLTDQLEGMRETFHTLATDLATARERAGRAEAERDVIRVALEELRARKWWQRRG